MSKAGVNLLRCGGREDLDRVFAVGMRGWVSLPVHLGATENLRKTVPLLVDHPGLAVWEGPDEIVWTFTAYSHLAKSAGFTREDWNNQTAKAVAYAEKEAKRILPAIRAGVRTVRELDEHRRPFWINEAADSDLRYVRGYVDTIDVTGCDYYAVRKSGSDLFDPPGRGVRAILRSSGSDWLLVLVNEDAHRHLGVEVSGLESLEGRRLERLYTSESLAVSGGTLETRLQGYEVQLWSTSRDFESQRTHGRSYGE